MNYEAGHQPKIANALDAQWVSPHRTWNKIMALGRRITVSEIAYIVGIPTRKKCTRSYAKKC